jgi:hypothetical protein
MMPRWLPFAASALGAAALTTVSVAGIAMRRWQLETENLVKCLASATPPELDRPRTVSFAALTSLPPPVERYFRSVLRDGGALMAVIDVVNECDRQELDEGALQRYLAEAAMFPTALLPERGVVWTPIDENHATASLTDGATTACLDFAFAATGEILGVSTARRWRAEKSGYAIGAWGGRYGQYEVHNGMRVPSEADVYWKIGGRRCSYITIRVTDASFDFEPAGSR